MTSPQLAVTGAGLTEARQRVATLLGIKTLPQSARHALNGILAYASKRGGLTRAQAELINGLWAQRATGFMGLRVPAQVRKSDKSAARSREEYIRSVPF